MSSRLDLVLAGGRVLDGTGAPARVLDVGVARGRIAVVAPAGTLRANRTIACKGLCVAPGFVDTHAHSDLRILVDPTLPAKTRQGVTAEVLGQDGLSVAPLAERTLADTHYRLRSLLGSPAVPWTWRSTAGYLDALAAARPSVDLSYLAPHGTIRLAVMDEHDRPATSAELARMVVAVEEALAEGAIGLSTSLAIPPCRAATTGELVALCAPVTRRRGTFVIRLRSLSDAILDGVDEAIEIARKSGVRLHVSHLTIAGIQNYAVIEDVIDRLEAAREAGIPVTADVVPYTSDSTALGAILPPWMHANGTDETVARLGSPEIRDRLRAELASPEPVDWDNFWKWSGPEGIVIAEIPSGREPSLVGRSIAESAARRGIDAFDLAFDLLAGERLAVSMLSHSQSEAIIARLLVQPWVNVCTHGLLGERPHPCTYGTYPRVFTRYVRDQALLSWEEAVRKMTSQGAEALGLGTVGRLTAGQRANVVVFDPDRVRDLATFAEPVQFPLGVRHVLTGGVPIVRDDVGTGNPGPGVVQRGVER